MWDNADTDDAVGQVLVGEVMAVIDAGDVIAKNSEVIPYVVSGDTLILNADARVIRLRTPSRNVV